MLTTAIGWVDSADNTGFNTVANSVELKYTLSGDTNLDGTVNATDYNRLVTNYKSNLPPTFAWDQGDFNYDRAVLFADFAMLAANYNLNVSSLATAAIAANTTTTTAAAVAAPASLVDPATSTPAPTANPTSAGTSLANTTTDNAWTDVSRSGRSTRSWLTRNDRYSGISRH